MVLLVDELCAILQCNPEKITQFLLSDSNRMKVALNLRWKPVQTIYKDKSGRKHKFSLSNITGDGAHEILTFGRLKKPWNSTICQFYFARHHIRIRYPTAPCAIEDTGLTGKKYYPVELLEMCFDPELSGRINTLTNCFHNLAVDQNQNLYKVPNSSLATLEPIGYTFARTSDDLPMEVCNDNMNAGEEMQVDKKDEKKDEDDMDCI